MIYGLVLRIRHFLYDKGWKKSCPTPVPSICVGNVTVGGTGKTPHVELLLRLLTANWKQPAVLSRGYKRKLKGFQRVPHDGSAYLYGDEPVQMARKFPDIAVAVDKDRVRGCEQLREAGVIVLDDAFQYRRLQPSLSIVLVDYNHPVYKDRLLPWGRLRDLPSRLKKADIVIVTKCPAYLDDEEREKWRRRLRLSPEHPLHFTTLRYTAPVPVFPDADPHYVYSKKCILVTGIAHNTLLRNYLSDSYKVGRCISLPDHHRYTRGDIRELASAVRKSATACLMTTEKDAQRLRDCQNVPEAIRQRLFYIPIEAAFLTPEEEEAFTQEILLVTSNP